MMWQCWASIPVLVCMAGCAAQRTSGPTAIDHEHEGANVLRHYHREAGDPDWLVRAGEFHGHLGPWLVLGAKVGHDALRRLDTAGYWDIEITVWLPAERQRQPWSCVLDGLQISTGATLGKQNIRMAWSPEVTAPERPAVCIVRRDGASPPRAGYMYRLNVETAAELVNLSPERLEGFSRDLAGRSLDTLFELRPLTDAELQPR